MKCVFFDVDGTLLPFGKGLPDDTRDALVKLRANGHKVFLATGRSPSELDPRLSAVTFDGGVYGAGAMAEADGERVLSTHFTPDDIAYIKQVCAEHGWLIMLQRESRSDFPRDFGNVFLAYVKQYVGGELGLGDLKVVDEVEVCDDGTKFVFITPNGDMDEAKKILGDRFYIVGNTVGVPQTLMAEIQQKGVHKGVGIEAVMAHYGLPLSDSVAFGDGPNDIEMIRTAGTGIAMGNACDELKAGADIVTLPCGEGGIAKALADLGLI